MPVEPLEIINIIMQITRAVLPIGFFVVGVWAFFRMGEGLKGGDCIEVKSHWGGLGSGLGGWRLSRPAGFLVVGCLCFLLSLGLMPGAAAGKQEARKPGAAAASGGTP